MLKCEDRSLGRLRDVKVANARPPQIATKHVPVQTNALSTFYDILIYPVAHLVQVNEIILVPEGPLCLAPYAAFMDYNYRYFYMRFVG